VGESVELTSDDAVSFDDNFQISNPTPSYHKSLKTRAFDPKTNAANKHTILNIPPSSLQSKL
jgi:hypothetical protein